MSQESIEQFIAASGEAKGSSLFVPYEVSYSFSTSCSLSFIRDLCEEFSPVDYGGMEYSVLDWYS